MENEEIIFTTEKIAEILKRDKELIEGKVIARDWCEIKLEMEQKYNSPEMDE